MWTFSSKPSFIFQNSTPTSVKLCFPTKKILSETQVLTKCASRAFQWQGPPFLPLVLLGISILLSGSPRALCQSWLVNNPSVIRAPTASSMKWWDSDLRAADHLFSFLSLSLPFIFYFSFFFHIRNRLGLDKLRAAWNSFLIWKALTLKKKSLCLFIYLLWMEQQELVPLS